jgi:hypothetical protein
MVLIANRNMGFAQKQLHIFGTQNQIRPGAGYNMNSEILKKRLIKEWTCLLLSVAGGFAGALLVIHVLPGIISVESYINFIIRTGWAMADFVFVAVILSVYLVRAILWTIKRGTKQSDTGGA